MADETMPTTSDVLFESSTSSKAAAVAAETAPRKADTDVFYNSDTSRNRMIADLQDTHADDLAAAGVDAADRAARREALATALAPLDTYGTGQLVAEAVILAELADQRGDPAPDEAQVRRWSAETRAKVIGAYGRDEAERLIVRTQKWAEAHPALWNVLSRRGIGSRAEVAIPLIERVRREGLGT